MLFSGKISSIAIVLVILTAMFSFSALADVEITISNLAYSVETAPDVFTPITDSYLPAGKVKATGTVTGTGLTEVALLTVAFYQIDPSGSRKLNDISVTVLTALENSKPFSAVFVVPEDENQYQIKLMTIGDTSIKPLSVVEEISTKVKEKNLLGNGGFDDNNVTGQIWPAYYWTTHDTSWAEANLAENANPDMQVVNSSLDAYSGDNYLSHTNFYSATSSWQEFGVPKTGVYKVSGYIKTNSTDENSSAMPAISILPDWVSPELAKYMPYNDVNYTVSQDWQEFSFEVNLTENTWYIIRLWNETISTVESWGMTIDNDKNNSDLFFAYDDLEIKYDREIVVVEHPNLLGNGGFEDDNTIGSWPNYHWLTIGETDLTLNANPNMQIVNSQSDAYSGDNYLVHTDYNNYSHCWQNFPIYESGIYVVSGYIKTNITDKNSGLLSAVSIITGWGESDYEVNKYWLYTDDSFSPFSGWKKFSFEVYLNENTWYIARIWNNIIDEVEGWGIPIADDDKNNSNLFFAYDDISVKLK